MRQALNTAAIVLPSGTVYFEAPGPKLACVNWFAAMPAWSNRHYPLEVLIEEEFQGFTGNPAPRNAGAVLKLSRSIRAAVALWVSRCPLEFQQAATRRSPPRPPNPGPRFAGWPDAFPTVRHAG